MFGVNKKVVHDWRKKVLQSMPKMRETMRIGREPQRQEQEQRLYDWENPEISTNKYTVNTRLILQQTFLIL